MGKFNLLNESWISVITDDEGNSKEVSLKELFLNAHIYKDLAGDTKTQDFALMRVLLAVVYTVFTRFDANGKAYEYFDLKNFVPVNYVKEDERDEYIESLKDTWCDLWHLGKFPDIIIDYLENWEDRFYLFDEKYPFFQVTLSDISEGKISKSKASEIAGKNINRLISESENKIALFSPKYSFGDNKEKLRESEIARWLITFQGYCGLSDKVIFGNDKYKASKGWLFDIGGIFMKGDNLFKTLMLNFAIDYSGHCIENVQRPCWECESSDIIDSYFYPMEDNISDLYTAWSRAVYINPEIDLEKPFVCNVVKLPEIEHEENFLEPMTIWKNNKIGKKEFFTPKKHQLYKSMWRSFGLITIDDTGNGKRKPGIIDWFNKLKEMNILDSLNDIELCAVSMQDDGNATSWVPTDEIIDNLFIDKFVLSDLSKNGWIDTINSVVEITKKVVEFIYKKYIVDIKQIRNISSDLFVSEKVEELYFVIDGNFRNWISNIKFEDEKNFKMKQWEMTLRKLVLAKAEEMLYCGCPKDYLGIIIGEKTSKKEIKNIATAYNSFLSFLNRELGFKEVIDGNKN